MFHGNLTWGFGVGSNREAILKIEKESNGETENDCFFFFLLQTIN